MIYGLPIAGSKFIFLLSTVPCSKEEDERQ